MTRTATPAEQARINAELDALIANVTDWDRALIEQAIHVFGAGGRHFSMNDFRDLLPESAHHAAGLVFLSMLNRKPSPLVKVGTTRSTSGPTHNKAICVYRLRHHTTPLRAAA